MFPIPTILQYQKSFLIKMKTCLIVLGSSFYEGRNLEDEELRE